MLDLSDNIKQLRKQRGLSQEALANLLGVSRVTVTRYENGNREPDNEMLIKLAGIFGTSIDTLLGFESYGIGGAIREERMEQGLAEEDLANSLNISVNELLQIEGGEIPINDEMVLKLEEALGLNYYEFLDKYDLYDDYIPPHFNGDIGAWENFKKAVDKDIEDEYAAEHQIKKDIISNFYKLNPTGQQEAAKRIEELTYIDKYIK